MKITNRIQRAIYFAEKAHAGQVRKYTGEPYLNKAIEQVQQIVIDLDIELV